MTAAYSDSGLARSEYIEVTQTDGLKSKQLVEQPAIFFRDGFTESIRRKGSAYAGFNLG